MANILLNTNVALSIPVNVSPLLDDTDFKTIENAIVYDSPGMILRWHFITLNGVRTTTIFYPTSGGLHDWTNHGSGSYSVNIPASGGTVNNDTEGYGWISWKVTGVLSGAGPIIEFRDSDYIPSVDVDTIKGQEITCANAIEILASVGTALESVAQSGDTFVLLGEPTTTSIAADIATKPSASQIQAELEENGASVLDTIRDAVTSATYGLSALKTLLDAIVADTGTDGVPLTASAVDAILDEAVEGSLTVRQVLRIILAHAAGRTTGASGTTPCFRDQANTKNRIAAVVDPDTNNRTSIVLDAS